MSPAFAKNINLDNPAKEGAKILVVTGASGGHIFPALAFLEALKDREKDIDTLLVLPRPFSGVTDILGKKNETPKETSREQIKTRGYNVRYLSISALELRFSFKSIVAIFHFFKGFLESAIILFQFRPDIVVAFGSLICLPLGLLAWIFRIKTCLHEQNVIPGRANRFLAKFVDTIAISFPETEKYLKASRKKIVLTGNPLRKQLVKIDKKQALDFFGLSKDKFTILITGGSQGSHKINLSFLEAISQLPTSAALQIIHLTGVREYNLLKSGYQDLNISAKLFSFFSDMQYAYSACDLVISRAGATTIAEIIFFQLPAILIPYPYAYKHQAANAAVLENIGSALVIADNALNSDSLRIALEGLLNNFPKIEDMRRCYERFPRLEAAKNLMDSVLVLH